MTRAATAWPTAVAALYGAMAVMTGAFGAHALKGVITTERLAVWQTASEYQLVHALALLWVAQITVTSRALSVAKYAFAAGVLVFSGSLYALVLTDVALLGAVTPIGGSLLIAGWFALLLHALKNAPL